MKSLVIVANWKANKTKSEALNFFEEIQKEETDFENKEVIVCPSFTLLAKANYLVSQNKLNIKIGSQDVSMFGKGEYTGEVSASQIKEFAQYAIIGHSERRRYFKEEDEILAKKVHMAIMAEVIPIFCVPSEDAKIPTGIKIIAYEPVSAIGTGNPDSPDDAEKIASRIKASNKQVEKVLYGGSVNSSNVSQFTKMDNIDGVLVGGASLSPHEFSQIVKNA